MKTIYKITLIDHGRLGEFELFYETYQKAVYACEIYSRVNMKATIPQSITLPERCANELLERTCGFLK